jgi:hypothetical protein
MQPVKKTLAAREDSMKKIEDGSVLSVDIFALMGDGDVGG